MGCAMAASTRSGERSSARKPGHCSRSRSASSARERRMDADVIRQAAALLVEARRTGRLLDGLPPSCHPESVAESEAIQAQVIAALGETVAGWKVATLNGALMGGAILAPRIFASPARVPAAFTPLRGVEAEIAFHFDLDMPPREAAYDYA